MRLLSRHSVHVVSSSGISGAGSATTRPILHALGWHQTDGAAALSGSVAVMRDVQRHSAKCTDTEGRASVMSASTGELGRH